MSDQTTPKQNWFLRHKFLTVILGFILIAGIIAVINANNDSGAKLANPDNGGTTNQTPATPDSPSKFKVGDVIDFDDKLVSILSVEHNWIADLTKPESGNKFVKIVVQVKNNSTERIDFNVISDWSIQDQNGKIDGASLWASSVVDNAYGSGELAAGGTLTGAVVFEVPDIDGQLIFIYEPGIWSNKELEIYE